MPRMIVLSALLLFSCGAEDSERTLPEENSGPPVVSYQIDEDGPKCSPGAVESTGSIEGCESKSCTWICSEKDGEYPMNAAVYFSRCNNEPWEVSSESSGPSPDPVGCEQLSR